MASHYQAHPGPGPSNYYMQSHSPPPPPQNYSYGPGSPAPGPPGPNGYPYQYAGSPMNSHHPGIPPQGPPPRGNGRGGGPGNAHGNGTGYLPQSTRGGHAYQQQPHPNFQRPPYAGAQYPQPQMQPKYPHAYQPHQPYAYAPPPPPPQVSAWGNQQAQHHHQQPLSPLPKGSPMSPLQELSLTTSPMAPYYNAPLPAQTGEYQNENQFPELPAAPTEIDVPQPQPAPASPPTSPSLASHPSYGQIGTISASSSASSPKAADTILSTPPASPRTSTAGSGGWAIWSRRPLNPSHAPGIIISPHAYPPPDVVFHAIDARTPPQSPVIKPLVIEEPAVDAEEPEAGAEAETEAEADSEVAETPSSGLSVTGAGTPTTPTTTIPSSPVSSNTSLSLQAKPSPPAASETAAPRETSPPPPAQDVPEPSPEPAPAPAGPPPKKSWASLLRTPAPTGSPAAPGAPPRKNGLPTSSVVGFSIPAAPPPAPSPADTARRAEALALLSGAVLSPPADTPTTRLLPRGLINTGNMCFANAVLQVLVYCAPFAQLFMRLRGLLGEGERGAAMVRATGDFLLEFVADEKASKSGNGKGKGKERAQAEEEEADPEEAFIPTNVYDALKDKKRFDHMRGGHQEDAEEFLGFYLDTLEEELLSIISTLSPPRTKAPAAVVEELEEEAPPETEDGWLEVGRKNRTVVTRTIKTVESPITRIFGGKFRSTLRAPGQKDSVIVEDWRSLRLDIQRDQIHTIQDALSFISHPQSVQMTHPARPGIVVDASQQILIEALPPILVLHVKRFCYDKEVGGVVKVGKQIAFGPELDIGSDVMAPTARRPVRYKLFGVIYHHGISASGGHYTLDVLHPTRCSPGSATTSPRDGWMRIDDDLVSDVRPEDVFGASERDDSRCAYLLFYKRIR
ncbi:hypothetical protein C8J57DRAFT_1125435 [Mycena rebaudengoi]|nr:hypothetical protein C8J57DRAFT_1125435 [Mycena rebaudengoi]